MINQHNHLLAAVTNPVIGNLGSNATEASSGLIFAKYFVSLWRAFISIGALAVIIFFIWGAFEWMTAGGDTKGVQSGRQRITNAVIGLILLVSSFTIVGILGTLIFGEGFDILAITFPSPN